MAGSDEELSEFEEPDFEEGDECISINVIATCLSITYQQHSATAMVVSRIILMMTTAMVVLRLTRMRGQLFSNHQMLLSISLYRMEEQTVATSYTSTWSSTLTPVVVKPFQSTASPGSAVPIPSNPGDVLQLFFTDELMNTMTLMESKAYALQVMGRDAYAKWSKFTAHELRAYLGFSILMSIFR